MKIILFIAIFHFALCSIARDFLVIAVEGDVYLNRGDKKIEVFDFLTKKDEIVLEAGSYIGFLNGAGHTFECFGPDTFKLSLEEGRGWKKIIKEKKSLFYQIFRLPTTERIDHYTMPFRPQFYYPHPFDGLINFDPSDSEKVCLKWICHHTTDGIVELKLYEYVKSGEKELLLSQKNSEKYFCFNPSEFEGSSFDVIINYEHSGQHIDVRIIEAAELHEKNSNKIDSPLNNLLIGFFLEVNQHYDKAEEYYLNAKTYGNGIKDYELYYEMFLLRKEKYQEPKPISD